MSETPLEQAIAFIESLTADPLLMGVDDIEMTLEDVQDHARIELESIKRKVAAYPAPLEILMGSEPPLDWSNFEGPKRNVEWKPDDQDLIYTAINYRDDEYGDADEDVGQQLVERLLAAWKTFAVSEQITFENAARLLRERDEARADIVPANEITDFLYKHGDLTYSAAARAVQLLSGNGYGFTNSSTDRKSALLVMRKALNKIADMIDAEDGDLDDAITIARAALSSPMEGTEPNNCGQSQTEVGNASSIGQTTAPVGLSMGANDGK